MDTYCNVSHRKTMRCMLYSTMALLCVHRLWATVSVRIKKCYSELAFLSANQILWHLQLSLIPAPDTKYSVPACINIAIPLISFTQDAAVYKNMNYFELQKQNVQLNITTQRPQIPYPRIRIQY